MTTLLSIASPSTPGVIGASRAFPACAFLACAFEAATSVARKSTNTAEQRRPDMTTIQIDLPDATVQAARDVGLLTAQALDRLLNEAIRRQQAADALLSIADRVASAGIAPMSMEEINAEVKATRAERRQRAAGSH